jgi:hypothetical protein
MCTGNRPRFCELGFWFLVAVGLMPGACAYRYAQVHIKTNTAASVDVYDAGSGIYLGQTPLMLELQRKRNTARTRLNLLLTNGEGCPSYWQRFTVPNWAENKSDAATAAYKNDVLFKVQKTDCETQSH